MIFDAIPFGEHRTGKPDTRASRHILAFVRYLEEKLGARFLRDARTFPLSDSELTDAFYIAEKLKSAGILTSLACSPTPPDEPRLIHWVATCGDPQSNIVAGASVDSNDLAIRAALAEGLERYLWFTQRDYFVNPTRATTSEISALGPCIPPERFVSFSPEQRALSENLRLTADSSYLWIQSTSLLSGERVFIPAQVASAAIRPLNTAEKEPLIRTQLTIGLATWPTQSGARLAGIAELLEREAFMIMWLNQLTLPRISLESVRGKNPLLDTLLARCRRYGLRVHAISMLTDAPLHAMCVIVEDTTSHAPRFAIGLKAHRSMTHALERALTEALRARKSYRRDFAAGVLWDTTTPVDKIGHRDRLYYWGETRHAKHLEFLVQGTEQSHTPAEWETDSPDKHLARLLEWCKAREFECVSVSMGTPANNPTPWHVEMVVMPDLVSTYVYERNRHLGGARLKSIPELFGYTPRTEPFIDAPHPYS